MVCFCCRSVGWSIGTGQDGPDLDQRESEALYDLLERDVVPTYYERRADGLPRRWIARMKSSIASLCHFFNTHRMVENYTETFYLPAHGRFRLLTAENAAQARALAAWLARVEKGWGQVRVEVLTLPSGQEMQVGSRIHARARVSLGELSPEDVLVELYVGRVNADGEIAGAGTEPLQLAGRDRAGCLYETNAAVCTKSGLHGYTVRAVPYHPDLATGFLPGLIAWGIADARAATSV